mgnify:CR=1 FL=1
MANYVLSCCSTADLSKEHFQSRDIHYVCFHYAMNGKEYLDDLGESMSFEDFYKAMADGAETRTSQVNISEYVEFFSKFLEQGLDVVHVCLSSGISGTINSARNAALVVKERFPERNVYIVDSLGASSGYGLLMDTAATKRDEGLSAEELVQWLEENKLKLHHWFFSTDLTSYVRGGRISKTAAVFGGLLLSHRAVVREQAAYQPYSEVSYMNKLRDFIRRDVFVQEANKLNYVAYTNIWGLEEFRSQSEKYVSELRSGGTYSACSGLARYEYLPRGQWEELFAASREGLRQVASSPDGWNLQVEFYRTESGKHAASRQVLELRASEMERYNAQLAAQVRELRIKVRRLEAAATTATRPSVWASHTFWQHTGTRCTAR